MIDFQVVGDDRTGEQALEVALNGPLLLNCPLLNKGSAFTEQERRDFGLQGLLPPHVSTLEEQAARRYYEYRQIANDRERFLFLQALQDRNETLYYRLLQQHIDEMMPIIYTPEVGDICQQYSHLFHRARGLFISYPQEQHFDALLANRPYRQVDVIVVTDGERILGLGDQGVGGMGIPVGKLALYTLCGGIHPGRTLPILLDVGTDNPEKLGDPFYLGWRHERVRGPEYDKFIEAFVEAVERHLPGVLLQWEDFGRSNARRLLERYRDRLCTFNDDLQGTAAVTLGVLLSALKITDSPLREQRIVVVGAGSAGTGISDLIVAAMVRDGLADTGARSRLWLVDRDGPLLTGMKDPEPFQQRYCQPLERTAGWKRNSDGDISLAEVMHQVRPTALIGVCGQPGTFTEEVVRTMAQHTSRPIILPLSNPTSRSEAVPAALVPWSGGRALIATGSPFPNVPYQGRRIPISQCNNSYIFPGLGLGVIAARAKRITEEMFLAAARVLSECSPAQSDPERPLLPVLEEIPAVSRRIALAVGAEAQRQGLATQLSNQEWERRVDATRWQPRYLPMRPGRSA
jgi:malate dehydrogenase (oxaloacetate-decarboxylating)